MALPKGASLAEVARVKAIEEEDEPSAKRRRTDDGDDGSAPEAAAPGPGAASGGDESRSRRLGVLLDEVDPCCSLDTDAEALVLNMIDDFVEQVTRRACEVARHRRAESLSVGDLQLVLRKYWGIELPGIPSIVSSPPS